MGCGCAPPSDQDEKSYTFPARGWGVGALSEFCGFTITVRTRGVVEAVGPTVSFSPVGAESKLSCTVFGCRSMLVVVLVPVGAGAGSCSVRGDGEAWGGGV